MEEKRNIFAVIKGGIVGTATAFTAAFGWIGWLVVGWVCCMALDWMSGSAAAKKNGEWKSSTARDGIWHKAGMILVVIIAAIVDGILGQIVNNIPGFTLPFTYGMMVFPVVICWYIFTELGSICENANKMGATIPDFLITLLSAGKLGSENIWDNILKKPSKKE
ncbi:phage holin family protein [Pygmaiobacter massiliensis]|uniref:phage holin family protein n=1 Tax=Pygmaiobacter massiliensis TaxID=1917873 RepID=UPI000C79D4A6|nr:phage holin family protein [Pygmaiobacter massiliensis]